MKNGIHNVRIFLARLPLVQYLGVQLLVGLAASVVCLWLFAALAEDVMEKSQIVTVDTAVADALHSAATPTSTAFYRAISLIGVPGVWILGLIVALFFISRKQRLHLAVWLVALIGGEVLNYVLKILFARPRPTFADPFEAAQNYSFPSGHAMISMIGFSLFTYFLWSSIHNHFLRILFVFASALLIILVGISRMTLGVHYFSDVIAGFAAGGVWLIACITTLSTIYKRKRAGDPAVLQEKTP